MSPELASNEVERLNFNYLLLAQRLIEHDHDAACFQLKISADTADAIAALGYEQMMRIASVNQLLMKLAIDDRQIIESLSRDSELSMNTLHTAIVMAGQG